MGYWIWDIGNWILDMGYRKKDEYLGIREKVIWNKRKGIMGM